MCGKIRSWHGGALRGAAAAPAGGDGRGRRARYVALYRQGQREVLAEAAAALEEMLGGGGEEGEEGGEEEEEGGE